MTPSLTEAVARALCTMAGADPDWPQQVQFGEDGPHPMWRLHQRDAAAVFAAIEAAGFVVVQRPRPEVLSHLLWALGSAANEFFAGAEDYSDPDHVEAGSWLEDLAARPGAGE